MAVLEFERPLRQTSPLTRGQKVKDAQWLMAGHSRFKGLAAYKDGDIDGIYGDVSADACARTWFWIGAPLTTVNGAAGRVFTQKLYEYLRPKDWRPLPTDWRKRRDQRIAAAVQTPGMKALEQAEKYLGLTEHPTGSNHTQFGVEFGMDEEPWCAIFESCMFRESGYVYENGKWKFRYSYVPTIFDDARHGRNGLRLVYTPQAGDVALFDVGGETLAHTAFVKVPPKGGYFTDLGGNTGPRNISNGGAVMSQRRSVAMVHSWVRVG